MFTKLFIIDLQCSFKQLITHAVIKMSFREELLKKKCNLKKTEVVEKEKPEQLIVKDESDYDRLMKETYFEVYYDKIEEFTFKSVILPLTIEEIQALHDAHSAFKRGV